MYYLTDEDFVTGEKNGLSKRIVYDRYYKRGWELKRALTEPLNPRNRFEVKVLKEYPNYKELLNKSGISYICFYVRVRKGMDIYTALTTPKIKPWESKKRQGRINKEHIEIALKNDICESTLKYRIYSLGWSIDKAISTPVRASGNHKRNKEV